jgi:hypothetical protein
VAAPLYEHKPVFLDHAADRLKPQSRSTRDLVGTIIQPRFVDGRIRGDIRVLDTESGRTFLALVEGDSPGIGMSHVVLARRSAEGTIVEAIEDVISVDAVVGPATTSTFRESTGGEAIEAAAMDAADLAVARSSPAERNDDVGAEESLSDSHLRAVLVERDALRSRLRELESAREQEARAERRDALLAGSGLPEWALTPVFREQCRAATSDADLQTLLNDRVLLVERLRVARPTSAVRAGPAESPRTDAFVCAIKRC